MEPKPILQKDLQVGDWHLAQSHWAQLKTWGRERLCPTPEPNLEHNNCCLKAYDSPSVALRSAW